MNGDSREIKKITTGYVTLPAESGQEKKVLELVKKWGADALRDSDGTRLSPPMLEMGYEIYSTICLVRADQNWPRKHCDMLPQKFLMSAHVTAFDDTVAIDLLETYFKQKYEIDKNHDPHKWWQVFDRTTGNEVDTAQWSFHPDTGKVFIKNVREFHVYTVNFLVYQIWDSTSMYNHLTNSWTCPHVMCIEPYHPAARRHLMEYFDNWLTEHPHTDVVRLTTLAYHFVLDSDKYGADKYRDWVGYLDTVSMEALEDFAKEYGYRLTSEDFVDQGYYHAAHRVPSKKYRDWMEFIHKFVIEFGKELIDKIHQAGKKAAIFQGDHWVGVEPYGPRYGLMGIDINVGACEDGVALRRLADSEGNEIKEARFYPYFFPDVFAPGGHPLRESISSWVKIRRALLRKGIDRIGYGGYLSLAYNFPEFVDHVADLCNEFRDIKSYSRKTRPSTAPIRVAVLNAWGKIRSWLNNFGRDQKFFVKRPDVVAVAGSNLLECLSGLPVEVRFLSFDDVAQNGVPNDINVIINDGEDGTSWSGGHHWLNEKIAIPIREWIYNGGGFLGCLGPTACQHQGRYFQLADVMGVDKEIGLSVMTAAIKFKPLARHFITDDNFTTFDFGIENSYVFCCDEKTQVLKTDSGGLHIHLAVKEFGRGRSAFLAGLPYSLENSRLLLRTLFWLAQKEEQLQIWFSSNLNTDCAAYPRTGYAVIVNNVDTEQTTRLYDGNGRPTDFTLKPYESKWFEI